MEQLDKVLSDLKTDKSRDPMGYANEVFKPVVAGDVFKCGTLKLMKRIWKDELLPVANPGVVG